MNTEFTRTDRRHDFNRIDIGNFQRPSNGKERNFALKLLPDDWPSDKTSHAVGFFAQSALELVHEMSWESYKLPALSPL